MAGTLDTRPLSHGPPIPVVGYGLGTANFKRGPKEFSPQIVQDTLTAIKAGFTHLDGAETYGNEEELGQAIQDSGLPRSTFFVTTKVHESIASPKQALDVSLKKLQTDYVDLYLIHAPFWNEQEKGITIEEAWAELEETYESGLAKAIGVSNFNVPNLERILKVAKIKPAVNQIEYNPYLQSPDIISLHKKHNILTAAYGPLIPITKGTPGPLDPVVIRLEKKYEKSSTQILLRWALQTGAVVVTTSSKEWRMREALDVSSFSLDTQDVEEITKAGKEKHVRIFWGKHFQD